MPGLSMNYAGWSCAKSISDSKCSSSLECGTYLYCDTVDATCRHCTFYPCSVGVMKTSEAMCNKTCPEFYQKLKQEEVTDGVIVDRDTSNPTFIIPLALSLSVVLVIAAVLILLRIKVCQQWKDPTEKVKYPIEEVGDEAQALQLHQITDN